MRALLSLLLLPCLLCAVSRDRRGRQPHPTSGARSEDAFKHHARTVLSRADLGSLLERGESSDHIAGTAATVDAAESGAISVAGAGDDARAAKARRVAGRIARLFEQMHGSSDPTATSLLEVGDHALGGQGLSAGARYGPTDPEGAGEPHETEGFDPQLGLAEPSPECRRIMNKWTSKCVFGPPES